MYRGRFGIIAGLRRMAAPAGAEPKGAYRAHVRRLKAGLPHAEAMETAVGGFFEHIGSIEAALLRHYGLPKDGYVIDVGCGSGRLAKPLSEWLDGRYLGIDVVPDLLAHARRLVPRPDWRFEPVDHIAIPEADGQADMVVFFSVLTHLTPEQGYWYLEEACRVLKPGGRIIFSFLEFQEPSHWQAFDRAIAATKEKLEAPLNVFLDRAWAPVWADHLGMSVVDVRGAADVVVPQGHLGQAICVLEKPR